MNAVLRSLLLALLGSLLVACAQQDRDAVPRGEDPAAGKTMHPRFDSGEADPPGPEGQPGQPQQRGVQGEGAGAGKGAEAASGGFGHSGPAPGEGSGIPEDAAKFLTGPVIRGTIVRGEGLLPVAGIKVSEYGVESPDSVLSDAKGVFSLRLSNEQRPAVLVEGEGWVPTIQLCTEASRLYFEGEYKIEMFDAIEDAKIEREETGQEPDPSLGRVVFNFQPLGSPGGVRALMKVPGAKAWIYDADDKQQAGDRIASPPGAGEVVYTGVKPGSWPVQIEAPPPLDCPGPDKVPVLAGVYTRSYYFCESPEQRAKRASRAKSEAGSAPAGGGAK